MKTRKDTPLYAAQQKARFETCKCGIKGCTVDHVIPVFLMLQLACFDEANHDTDNFEFVCRLCGSTKAARLDHTNPKTLPLLKKYVALYELRITGQIPTV